MADTIRTTTLNSIFLAKTRSSDGLRTAIASMSVFVRDRARAVYGDEALWLDGAIEDLGDRMRIQLKSNGRMVEEELSHQSLLGSDRPITSFVEDLVLRIHREAGIEVRWVNELKTEELLQKIGPLPPPTLDEALLASGIIDKHTAQMMERWGSLEPSLVDKVDTKRVETREQFCQFAKELVPLLGMEEGRYREARLDALSTPKFLVSTGTSVSSAQKDPMGRLICDTQFDGKIGEEITVRKGEQVLTYFIVNIEKLHLGNKHVANQVTVEPKG